MKILIVGAGFIGEVHLRIIKKYNLAEVSICEVNKKRLFDVVEKYNLNEYYSDINTALNNSNFDGAIICTPNNMHAENAIKFLERGIGVLVEKPMTHTISDAEKMLEIANKNNTFIYVAYVLRHYKPFIKMKEIISEGKIGNFFSMRAVVSSRETLTDAISAYRGNIKTGGTIIHDYSHEIDYSNWFMSKKICEIYCRGLKLIHKNWSTFDTVDILLVFEDGRTSSLHLDYIQPTERRYIELYGTDGTLLWIEGQDIKLYTESTGCWQGINVCNDYIFDDPFKVQLQNYISCLRSNYKPAVSGEEGLEIIKIISACIKSAEKNSIVFV